MAESEFLKACDSTIHWFDSLEPYGDGISLLKREDENFALGDKGSLTELFCVAISAKRYALFNIGSDGKPILRKVLAHGLGHLIDPYSGAEAPKSIPAPSQELRDCPRWQHDLWYRIVCAHLEGHPDQIDWSDFPALDGPAKSRYSATTPALLSWFGAYNAGKERTSQVTPFNFMSAYSVSKTRFAVALARGRLSAFSASEMPSPIAPYSKTEDTAQICFDRKTGQLVPATILKTYREALAEYAFHAEAKFENAEPLARGLTERRHVYAVAVEYIGKEAYQLETRYYLGDMPEAAIEYGISPAGVGHLGKVIGSAAKQFGQSALADQAGITRQQLAAIVAGDTQPRIQTLRRLVLAAQKLRERASSRRG